MKKLLLTMRGSFISKALRFRQIYNGRTSRLSSFKCISIIKTSSQNSISYRFCLNFTNIEAASYWRKKLSWKILEEEFPVPRNTAASKKGNNVIWLLWQLRCHCYPDQCKCSSSSNTAVAVIFPNLCKWRCILCPNLGGINPEKLHKFPP